MYLYYCCCIRKGISTNKLKVVMKADELEFWIASLPSWNLITEQRNH